MLLRIFLILAILAGAGVIAISQLKVRPHIQSIIDERTQQTDRATKAEGQLKQTRNKLSETEKDLSSTKRTLEETQGQLTAANAKVEDQGKRLTQMQQSLDNTQKDLTGARQELALWNAFGLSTDQIKVIVDSQKKLEQANVALEEEKKLIMREFKATKAKLDEILGGDERAEVPLPPGLKGKVLVVDPKWNFVVLDIGKNQGALEKGVMMVSRESKLVAKVKIVSVQNDRSIANIMPDWKLNEVLEGDAVIY